HAARHGRRARQPRGAGPAAAPGLARQPVWPLQRPPDEHLPPGRAGRYPPAAPHRRNGGSAQPVRGRWRGLSGVQRRQPHAHHHGAGAPHGSAAQEPPGALKASSTLSGPGHVPKPALPSPARNPAGRGGPARRQRPSTSLRPVWRRRRRVRSRGLPQRGPTARAAAGAPARAKPQPRAAAHGHGQHPLRQRRGAGAGHGPHPRNPVARLPAAAGAQGPAHGPGAAAGNSPGRPLRLAEQREFYETILDELPIDVAAFDSEHRYRFVNTSGIADPVVREWIVGKNDADFCTHHQLPAELAAERTRRFELALHQRAETQWEETLLTPAGPQRMQRQLRPVYGADGALRLLVGLGLNVTERHRAEKKLHGRSPPRALRAGRARAQAGNLCRGVFPARRHAPHAAVFAAGVSPRWLAVLAGVLQPRHYGAGAGRAGAEG
nr:hypothetical protein [Tanacetum cinerariifolium]